MFIFLSFRSDGYGMPFPAARQLPYKVMSKFDKLVDFTFVNLYHVRRAIAEPEVTNAETTD